jgi:hypothetical protein
MKREKPRKCMTECRGVISSQYGESRFAGELLYHRGPTLLPVFTLRGISLLHSSLGQVLNRPCPCKLFEAQSKRGLGHVPDEGESSDPPTGMGTSYVPKTSRTVEAICFQLMIEKR